MLIFLSFYLCSGSGSPQSAWSCYWSDSVWATSTVGLSAPRSSSADSGWFGSLKSEDFQNVCIFGRNFHNCRSKVEVERKTRELASVSLCQNVISTSPTGIWNNEHLNNLTNISTNKYWWLELYIIDIYFPSTSIFIFSS